MFSETVFWYGQLEASAKAQQLLLSPSPTRRQVSWFRGRGGCAVLPHSATVLCSGRGHGNSKSPEAQGLATVRLDVSPSRANAEALHFSLRKQSQSKSSK